MRIGVDIDGCVYPWTRAVNEAVEERFGVQGLIDHPHWDYLKHAIGEDEWRWCWSLDAVRPVFGRFDLVYPHAVEVVNQLCADHEVHFVTHRNPHLTAAITAEWISYYFDGYQGLHICDTAVSKTTLGTWDVFIDDKPQTVHEFRLRTHSRILSPRRPWNDELGEGRFGSWLDVPELLAR